MKNTTKNQNRPQRTPRLFRGAFSVWAVLPGSGPGRRCHSGWYSSNTETRCRAAGGTRAGIVRLSSVSCVRFRKRRIKQLYSLTPVAS